MKNCQLVHLLPDASGPSHPLCEIVLSSIPKAKDPDHPLCEVSDPDNLLLEI